MEYMVRGYWNDKNNCLIEAKKYLRKVDLKKNCNCAYKSLCKNGWLEEACSHMENAVKPVGYWTLERCIEEGKNHTSRSDFWKNSRGAWNASQINGWLDIISAHIPRRGSMYKRIVYVYEFSDNSAYVGLTYDMNNRQTQRNLLKTDSVTKYINESGLTPIRRLLTDYIDVDSAAKLECFYIEKYRSEGWNILNQKIGGGVGGKLRKWSKEKIINAIKEYKYYHILNAKHKCVFGVAKKGNFEEVFDELFAIVDGIEISYWDYKKCLLDLKYKKELIKKKY